MEGPASNRIGSFDSDRECGVAATENMAPVATPFFFYLYAAIMLIGGVMVITRKNPVHSALALIVALLAQASIYIMLYAPCRASRQLIRHAGCFRVPFVFVIML